MKRYRISAEVTISLHGEVSAKSKKDAIRIASELSMPSLCHRCADGGDGEESWGLSGELDGEPRNISVEEC